MQHKFILEGHYDGSVTLWFVKNDGRHFPVRHFSPIEQDHPEFETKVQYVAEQYVQEEI